MRQPLLPVASCCFPARALGRGRVTGSGPKRGMPVLSADACMTEGIKQPTGRCHNVRACTSEILQTDSLQQPFSGSQLPARPKEPLLSCHVGAVVFIHHGDIRTAGQSVRCHSDHVRQQQILWKVKGR
eukprot:362622-Chlamydomonas_euryale.AAC.6